VAAVVTIGLAEHVVSAGDGASIMLAALASIVVSGVGVALLARRRPPVEPAPAAAATG
jgi:hypothetical protein